MSKQGIETKYAPQSSPSNADKSTAQAGLNKLELPQAANNNTTWHSLEKLNQEDLISFLQSNTTSWKDFQSWLAKNNRQSAPDVLLLPTKETIKSSAELVPDRVLELLSSYLASPLVSSENKLSMQRDLAALASPDFSLLASTLKKQNFLLNNHLPYNSMREILHQSSFNRNESLSVLASKNFSEFSSFLRNAYGLNAEQDLVSALDYYLREAARELIAKDENQKLFQLIKKTFPDAALNSPSDLSLLERLLETPARNSSASDTPAQLLEKIQKNMLDAGDMARFLKDKYGVTVDDAMTIGDLAELRSIDQASLRSGPAREYWQYLQTHHPSALSSPKTSAWLLDNNTGFLGQCNELARTRCRPATIDSLLQLFGLNLGSCNRLQIGTLAKLQSVLPSLSRDPALKAFADTLLSAYPTLRGTMDIGVVCGICESYLNRSQFELLQKAKQALNSNSALLPDLQMDNADLKIRIFNTLQQKGLSRIIAPMRIGDSGPESDFGSLERNQLLKALTKLEGDQGLKLYKVLCSAWERQNLELGRFLEILSDEKLLSFFLNQENARTYHALNQRYPGLETTSLVSTNLKSSLSSFPEDLEFILQHEQLLQNPNTVELYKRYLSPTQLENSNNEYHFASLLDNCFKSPSTALHLGTILESKYGLGTKEVASYLASRNDNLGTDLNRLKQSETQAFYQWLQLENKRLEQLDITRKGLLQSADLLTLACSVSKPQAFRRCYETISNLGIPCFDNQTFDLIQSDILSDPTVIANLARSDFRRFFLEVNKTYYDGINRAANLAGISDLFSELQKEKHLLSTLFSSKTQQVLSFMRSRFGPLLFEPSALLPLARLAETFDEKRLNALMTRLEQAGEKLTASDLVLLSAVLNNPAQEARLFKRSELEQKLSEHYAQNKSFERHHLDFTRSAVDSKKEKGTLLMESTGERPPVEELSLLNLYRIDLIREALNDPKLLQQLGLIVSHDLVDRKSEHGGMIRLQDGQITLRDQAGVEWDDGAYESKKDYRLSDGICTFHLHALEPDLSVYSGPSGSLLDGTGDLGHCDEVGGTDVVFTTLGHPQGASGPDLGSVRVNVDLYYIDKREPNKKKAHIVDLGEVTVPLDKVLMQQRKQTPIKQPPV